NARKLCETTPEFRSAKFERSTFDARRSTFDRSSMAIIKKSCIENIKARVSLYDVVSPTVTLRKAGSSWKGLSPFTNEKTPSFFVSPDKGLFKCFSSGKAGDIFSFLMETE